MIQIESSSILCEAAYLNQRNVQEKSVCSDSNQIAQLIQTIMCKTWSLVQFWFDWNQSLQPFGSKWNAMFESHVGTCIDRTSFDFQFKLEDFLGNLLLKIIIYCDTDQPTKTQSRRSGLNFKLSVLTFFEIDELLCEHWSKIDLREKISNL